MIIYVSVFAAGCLLGLAAGRFIRRRKRASKPVGIGYDPANPLNSGRSWQPFEVDGVTLYMLR